MTQTSHTTRTRLKPIELDGEIVQFLVPEDSQFVALLRCYEVVKADIPLLDKASSLTLGEDILLSLLDMPEDWMTKYRRKLALGETTLGKLTNAFFTSVNAGAADEEPAKPAVKRGRPRKNAVKSAE